MSTATNISNVAQPKSLKQVDLTEKRAQPEPKTPRHAHGDVKSSQSSPSNQATYQDGSSPRTPESPVSALLRCSKAAALRRRILVAQKNVTPEATTTAPPSNSRSARNHQPNHAAGQWARARPTGGPSAHKPPALGAPQLSRLDLHTYYRELITEQNGLHGLVRYAAIDFVPAHADRLLSDEIDRVQTILAHTHRQRRVSAHAGLNGLGSVLQTIGRPPLRVPPAILAKLVHGEQPRPDRKRRSCSLDDAKLHSPSPPSSVNGDKPCHEQLKTGDEHEMMDKAEESEHAVQIAEALVSDEPDSPDLNNNMNDADCSESSDSTSCAGTEKAFMDGAAKDGKGNLAEEADGPAAKPNPAEAIMEVPGVPSLKVVYQPYQSGDGRHGTHSQCAKIFVPKVDGYNFIGRIIGPRGISVRSLEAETGCQILIRGKGSVKDPKREDQLRNRSGWEHLKESLHVLVIANDVDAAEGRARVEQAAHSIRHLLTPLYDEYKRQQLIQLAIINGTYRP